MMNRFVVFIITLLLCVIVGEIIAYFLLFNPQQTHYSAIQPQPTITQVVNTYELDYKPLREYSGRFVSLAPGTGGYKYKLTYISTDTDVEHSIFIGPQEADGIILQYLNSENELIREEEGLQVDSLQSEDMLDILVKDEQDEVYQNSSSNNYKVDKIVIKIYKTL